MNPGLTFERVYVALKEQLTSGRYPPSSHLEPAALGEELNASITPVRDALHRLVGERLVEAPRNDGFRVPILTELMLRQLYGWQSDLLLMALAYRRTALRAERLQAKPLAIEGENASDLLLELGRSAGNSELMIALVNACERLAPARSLEQRFIPDLARELKELRELFAGDPAALRPAILGYRRRRERAVPLLVAALHGSL
jgi:DNA-binding GntR family transcriptional regulator